MVKTRRFQAETAKQVAHELKRLKFLERHKDKMRKSMVFTWVSGRFEVPLWMVSALIEEANGDRRKVNNIVKEYVRKGLSLNMPRRNVRAGSEETGILTVRIGGELARAVEDWRVKRRSSMANALRDLIYWGVNL